MEMKEKASPPAEEPNKEVDCRKQAALSARGGDRIRLIIIAVAAMAVVIGGALVALKFPGESAPSTETTVASARLIFDPGSLTPIETPNISDAENTRLSIPGAGHEGQEASIEAPAPVTIEFKPFVVNLKDTDGRRFLKLTMSVEAESETLGAEISSKTPQIRHNILLLLTGLTYDDLATLEDKMKLRHQMIGHINSQLTTGSVKNIYFSELVVQ